MAYRLYGDLGSGSAIVELALAEIGASFNLGEVPLHENAQFGAEYAAINPQKKLPCLVTPEGETLTESAAILLTLDERHQEHGLFPTDSVQRAIAFRWLLFMATELYPVIEIVDYPERFQPEGAMTSQPRRQALKKHAEEIWRTRFLLVEQAVAGSPFFLESGFSGLDIYVSVLSRWTRPVEFRRSKLPKVENIVSKLSTRNGLDAIWQRHFNR